jgi:hypothetical protein
MKYFASEQDVICEHMVRPSQELGKGADVIDVCEAAGGT